VLGSTPELFIHIMPCIYFLQASRNLLYICVLTACMRDQILFPQTQLYCFCKVNIFFNLKKKKIGLFLFRVPYLQRQSWKYNSFKYWNSSHNAGEILSYQNPVKCLFHVHEVQTFGSYTKKAFEDRIVSLCVILMYCYPEIQ
jgi:hypothetical protein